MSDDVKRYLFLPQERVIHGRGAVEHLPRELERLGCARVLLLTGRTIATKTPLLDRLRALLGERLVAVYAEVSQHTPTGEVMAAVQLARQNRVDGLVSLGGGSVIDGTKAVARSLHEGFMDREELLGRSPASGQPGPLLPHIALPTTLSAAEYAGLAGVTDESGPTKMGVGKNELTPRVVILDPELTPYTPNWLWAATGMRALDHAVESLTSPDRQRVTDLLATEAIRLLFTHLPAASEQAENVELRGICQEAAWLSYFGAGAVRMGLSHNLGRRIGARFNVAHGVTSALTLPSVMRLIARRDPERLRPVAAAAGLPEANADAQRAALAAADAVADLAQRLGLPVRLRDAGIKESDLDWIAQDVGDEAAIEVVRAAF